MAQSHPPSLCLLYASADREPARDLERMFSLLVKQNKFRLWTPKSVLPGQIIDREIKEALRQADVILLLMSADFVAEMSGWILLALAERHERQARVVPVLLRPTILPQELSELVCLPRSGVPLRSSKDLDAALVEVVEEVSAVTVNLPRKEPSVSVQEPPGRPVEEKPAGAPKSPPISRENVFQPYGMPEATLVEPQQLRRLRAELRRPGRGLIVEGPSKVGKTTAVLMALEEHGLDKDQVEQLDGKLKADLARLPTLLSKLKGGQLRHLIIDDFHRVNNEEVLNQLAISMKNLADQVRPTGKITLIGVSPLGGSLTRLLPDLSGRYWVIQMDRQPDTKIAELITRGEIAAGVRFENKDELISEADGNFHIAQLLCMVALDLSNSTATVISVGVSEVVDEIHDALGRDYFERIRDFAGWDKSPPPRGACLALLWLLSQTKDGYISLQEAKQRFPTLADAVGWLQESNLRRCIETYPNLDSLFYFNPHAGVLSLEDPRLRFYLRKLDWNDLAQRSGHKEVRFDPKAGLLFPAPMAQSSPISTSPTQQDPAQQGLTPKAGQERLVLHLSDLHFSSADVDQIMRFYSPLAQDLYALSCQRLDALVVSGDIGTVADPKEYVAARQFLEELMGKFSLSPRQVLLVPGNHDLSWGLSEAAYSLQRLRPGEAKPKEGTFIAHSNSVLEVRNDALYRERFRPFSQFYKEIKGEDYPLDEQEQAILCDIKDAGLLLLGLNSAWQIDHHFTTRISLNEEALGKVLSQLPPAKDGQLRLAAWHHPLISETGQEHIQNNRVAQQLILAGFRIALHGHIHQSGDQVYRFSQSPVGQKGNTLEVIAGGTFGAPVRQWSAGYPLQYNLLRVRPDRLIVETRRRLNISGAWQKDSTTELPLG